MSTPKKAPTDPGERRDHVAALYQTVRDKDKEIAALKESLRRANERIQIATRRAQLVEDLQHHSYRTTTLWPRATKPEA